MIKTISNLLKPNQGPNLYIPYAMAEQNSNVVFIEEKFRPAASQVIRNCHSCGHCIRESFDDPRTYKCMLTGRYCVIQRSFPKYPCDANLSGWVPRPAFTRLRRFFGRIAHNLGF